MNSMLIPWIILWIAPAIHKQWGCLLTLGVCALVPLFYYRNRKTFYDILTNALVTGISAAMLAGGSEKWLLPLSYLSFGLMWSVSCFVKIPLTANYSMDNYGGANALQNALFLKTNRILTMLWGGLYLLTAVFTWFLMRTPVSSFVGLINSILPVFMGIFTVWFQKWYPAKAAGGT